MNRHFKHSLLALSLFGALATQSPVSALPADGTNNGIGRSSREVIVTTVRGTINRFGGNRAENFGAFELRAESGTILRVLVSGDARFVTNLSNFRNNARIEIEGLRDGDAFLARDVRFEENGRYVSILRGTVQDLPRNNRFVLALDTNFGTTSTTSTRTVVVVDRNPNARLFRSLRRGDVVEVHGAWQGSGRWMSNSTFAAESIVNTNGSVGLPDNDEYLDGRIATLRGTATDDTNNSRFVLDMGNGRTLSVRADAVTRIRRGDTVEVHGRYDSTTQFFRADTVRVLTGVDSTTGASVNFPATVIDVLSTTRLTVRGDNGRTYEVASNTILGRNISRNDRVRITGYTDSSGVVRAERVLLEGDVNSTNIGRTADIVGVITATPTLLLRDYYTVRGDDGRDYRVNFGTSSSLRRGDRVRVRGTFDDTAQTVVNADSITRY